MTVKLFNIKSNLSQLMFDAVIPCKFAPKASLAFSNVGQALRAVLTELLFFRQKLLALLA